MRRCLRASRRKSTQDLKLRIFYHFIAGLKKKVALASPSKTHHFFKALEEKGVLARVYTQNIDDLDERAG